jgi:hypothetical protein
LSTPDALTAGDLTAVTTIPVGKGELVARRS